MHSFLINYAVIDLFLKILHLPEKRKIANKEYYPQGTIFNDKLSVNWT